MKRLLLLAYAIIITKGGDGMKNSIQEIIDWVEAHIKDSPTLTDIARQVGYSPFYCSTMFHEVCGMTLRDYIALRRIAFVAHELTSTRKPIVDLALEYGFSSQPALTRAFKNAYGISPSRYRKKPVPIPLQVYKKVSFQDCCKGEDDMRFNTIDVRTEFIPAHKYLGVYKPSETKNGPIWAGHDCDLACGIIESIPNTERIVARYTAGWDNSGGERKYFFGSGIDLEAPYVDIPEGFELRELPESYYLVFAHPPFKYPEENGDVMGRVEELAWNFDPTQLGLEWNEQECQCYQRHYPEVLGYQVLRPVRKIKK